MCVIAHHELAKKARDFVKTITGTLFKIDGKILIRYRLLNAIRSNLGLILSLHMSTVQLNTF